MIHPNLIKRRADEDGLSAPAVERDYVLAHALAAISRHDEQAQIVFKGGTALRLCHFDDYRYSADLDFSLVDGLNIDRALLCVAEALVDCKEHIGFPLLRLSGAAPPRIEYVGPLDAKPRSLKLDLAHDELVENTTTLPIARRYDAKSGRFGVRGPDNSEYRGRAIRNRQSTDGNPILTGSHGDGQPLETELAHSARHASN